MDGETLSLNHGRYSLSLSSHSASYFTSFLPLLPHSSFCTFSFLTFCHVESSGDPGVNCSASNGWRKARSNFHTFLQVHCNICRTLRRLQSTKRNRHLSASQLAGRRKGQREGERDSWYRSSHLTSCQNCRDY